MESQNQNVKIIVCTGGAWETVYGILRYKPLGLPKRVLPLPLNLTYSRLMTCVARKLNTESMQSDQFRMTYQFPISSSSNRNKYVVVDIADDEDVDVFMDMVVKTTHGLITLYVVEASAAETAAAAVPSRWEQSRATGNRKGNPIPTRVFSFQQLFPEREGANVGGKSKDPAATQVVDSEDDFGDATDWFGDQKGNRSKSKPGSPEGTDGNIDRDTLWSMSPRAPTPAPDTTLKLNTPVFSKNENDTFDWGMPPFLRDTGPSNNPKAPDPITPNVFNSKEALKLTLKLKSVEEGFKIKTTRSTKDLYEVRCLSDGCYWRIRGTRVHGTDMFRVENFEVQHKCSRAR